jgi:hypothetical protein
MRQLAARLARLVADGSPGTVDALVAQVAGSTGLLLIVTTFGPSELGGRLAWEPLVLGRVLGRCVVL